MFNPGSTYRIQFHKDFTFDHFEKIIPYLKSLGVKTVYASPIFKATPGSMHGYDGVDPETINPEIGTMEQLYHLRDILKANGISWIQDIVPNHMAFHSSNVWLMDVLEKGQSSEYSAFFDIMWSKEERLMVPFLGDSIENIIRHGELHLRFNNGKFHFNYYDQNYPVNIQSYISILSNNGNESEEVKRLIDKITSVKEANKSKPLHKVSESLYNEIKSSLTKPEVADYIQKRLTFINSQSTELANIHNYQYYRLCHWQETDQRINFRRFFTINGLISLNIQNPIVFERYHSLVKKLIEDKVIQGIRVDHIDGLYDPENYLKELRKLVGEDTYIVVEKILEPGESLPQNWNIQGTTGYDFLSIINNVLTNAANKKISTEFYNELIPKSKSIHQEIHDKKAFILYNYMAGDLENLTDLFVQLNLVEEKVISNLGTSLIKHAIAQFLIQCPVYRFYGNEFPLSQEEQSSIEDILKRMEKSNPNITPAVTVLKEVFLTKPKKGNKEYNEAVKHFYGRCMQFTGPLMAKGVEDTLMYTYNRAIGHNEVGDSPESFGMSVADFHKAMNQRHKYWKIALNATSTHDTKRGEDASARLNVLTDLAEEWKHKVNEWKQLNNGIKNGKTPDLNDEYFIYQTLIATYPMPGQKDETYPDRLAAYLTKAFREAKRNTNWTNPNSDYEGSVNEFATKLLNPNNAFIKSFHQFHQEIADLGILNSISKIILKFTCPGIPDTYQGTELWDLSFVDPDNRRAVNYEYRTELLDKYLKHENKDELINSLWVNRFDGTIKLWLLHNLLSIRKDHSDLFNEGNYQPIEVKGKYKDHILAFARRHKQEWIIVALPLHIGSLCRRQKTDLQTLNWKNTRLILPHEMPEEATNSITGVKKKHNHQIFIAELYKEIPIGILSMNETKNIRGAGILMHITSLPSSFGIGDFGPGARKFAQFLSRCKQKYWQILPLNPTESGNGHSPYSSISSMAGNTLLISPDLLAKENLISKEELKSFDIPSGRIVDYRKAEEIKRLLFDIAYTNFKKNRRTKLHSEFEEFLARESYWLHDFSSYLALKQKYFGKPWYEWPEQFRSRNAGSLKEFREQHQEAIEKTEWLQFIFTKQWQELKKHCNESGIQLFGDLPFYVSYDSADVWVNPDIFSLDEKGKMIGVAGVPPDYFNADGQLWGMPVFRWDVLKKRNYDWWIQRIRKNMELYDLLRLDHFRAFADYWEVPASEKTARKGEWKNGPGKDFFDAVKSELGDLPFIAEDLGDISEAVVTLREELQLPGMKVLQFAFGNDMPDSIFAPHNYTTEYVAYTGTHDNNTTVGWFRENIGKTEKQNLKKYTGLKVREKNIHKILGRLAYSSVAKIAILPIQDLLGLNEKGRMNLPASTDKNWLWRLKPGQLQEEHEKLLRRYVKTYNRK